MKAETKEGLTWFIIGFITGPIGAMILLWAERKKKRKGGQQKSP